MDYVDFGDLTRVPYMENKPCLEMAITSALAISTSKTHKKVTENHGL